MRNVTKFSFHDNSDTDSEALLNVNGNVLLTNPDDAPDDDEDAADEEPDDDEDSADEESIPFTPGDYTRRHKACDQIKKALFERVCDAKSTDNLYSKLNQPFGILQNLWKLGYHDFIDGILGCPVGHRRIRPEWHDYHTKHTHDIAKKNFTRLTTNRTSRLKRKIKIKIPPMWKIQRRKHQS